ncbi:hypothetical protein [Methylorubrum thiocyanatum]|nr:hypothetical protein [Methylorubrum thiocyanatum]
MLAVTAERAAKRKNNDLRRDNRADSQPAATYQKEQIAGPFRGPKD